MASRQFGKIYVMLGINEMGYDRDQTVAEYEKMIELLAPSMDVAITITPPGPRGLDKETLANLILSKKLPVDMVWAIPKEKGAERSFDRRL